MSDSTYVVDTCSFIAVENWPIAGDTPKIWALMTRLANSGQLVTSEFVLTELKRNDEAAFTAVNVMRHLVVATIDDPIGGWAGYFTFTYPRVGRPRRRNHCADPWLLALAKVRGSTMVTEESDEEDGIQRIPHVCATEGIACVNLAKMVAAEGL